MTFLAPGILFALAAAALPVVIHLLNRGRTRPMPWAAMRFLLASVQKNQRKLRLRDLLLLLLRILAIALVVLLFARPAWLVSSPGGELQLPMTAMIVLDVSASMAQSDGRRTRFEEARALALEVIDRLDDQSQAGLLLASDVAQPVVPRPSSNLPLVRGCIERTAVTWRASNLFPALKTAYAELERAPGRHKEIIVLTDNQKLAWQNLGDIEALRQAQPGIGLRVLTVGGPGEENLAIRSLSPAAGTSLAGSAMPVRVEVENHGREEARNVRVTLAVDREPPQAEGAIASIAPGQSAVATIDANIQQAGPHVLTARLPADRFPMDNERSIAFETDRGTSLVIVEDPPAGDPRLAAGYYLQLAYESLRSDPLGGGTVTVRRIPYGGLDAKTLGEATAILLVDPGELPGTLWQQLQEFVASGHGLEIFPGPRTPANLGSAPPTAWLPARLAGPASVEPAAWQQSTMTHPLTAGWRDPAKIRLSEITASRHFPLAGREGAAALAAFANGDPVVVEGVVGGGRVFVWSLLPTPAWTNLVLHPFFPILMQELVPYFHGGEGGGKDVLRPGDSYTFTAPAQAAGREVLLQGPEGGLEPVDRLAAEGSRATVRIPDLSRPGGYLVYLAGEKEPAAAFAVAMDPAESDLATAEAERIAALERAPVPAGEEASAGAAATSVPMLTPREMWLPLATALALLFAAELFYSQYLSRAR